MPTLLRRNAGVGRGYLAREGNTGAIVWNKSRDMQTIGKTVRVALTARPGQMVFTNGGTAVVPPNTALV